MSMYKVDRLNNIIIDKLHTKVVFCRGAADDYKSFAKGKRMSIIKMILKQAEKGAHFKPYGNGKRCDSPLNNFAKIKSKSLNLRIIYRPRELKNGVLQMEIIAIGPRDELKAYNIAAKRLMEFYAEFGKD